MIVDATRFGYDSKSQDFVCGSEKFQTLNMFFYWHKGFKLDDVRLIINRNKPPSSKALQSARKVLHILGTI